MKGNQYFIVNENAFNAEQKGRKKIIIFAYPSKIKGVTKLVECNFYIDKLSETPYGRGWCKAKMVTHYFRIKFKK